MPAPPRKAAPWVVALTGGIASGKSAVSERFGKLGVPVIDTDVIARELVEPGRSGLEMIVSHFGEEVLDASGRLDRRRLRDIIFRDPRQKAALEAILHPAILAEAERRIGQVGDDWCLVVIPLLAEIGPQPWMDRVLVVDVAPETQLQRLVARDGISEGQARAMMAAQATREARLRIADDVLENSGSLADLDATVEKLAGLYQRLALESHAANQA